MLLKAGVAENARLSSERVAFVLVNGGNKNRNNGCCYIRKHHEYLNSSKFL